MPRTPEQIAKQWQGLTDKRLQLQAENKANRIWTLQKLENIEFYIDRENFLRFNALTKGIKGVLPNQPQWAIGNVLYKNHKKLNWRTICVVAAAWGIPAELLVDEDYYYKQNGIAGYRIMFEAYRQNVSLEELTRPPERYAKEPAIYNWIRTWYTLFKGKVTYSRVVRAQDLSDMLKNCQAVLNVPLSMFLGSNLHRDNKAMGIYGELLDILRTLNKTDLVFLISAAKILWWSSFYGKYHTADKEKLCQKAQKDMFELVNWIFKKHNSEGCEKNG